jgi:hypothetical protein
MRPYAIQKGSPQDYAYASTANGELPDREIEFIHRRCQNATGLFGA